MRLNWEEIRYQWNDLAYRPEVKRRLAIAAAIGLIGVVAVLFVISLTWGAPEEKKAAQRPLDRTGAPLPDRPTYGGAKEFASELSSTLASDARFTGVAVVAAATATGETSRIVLMGNLPRADLAALRSLVAEQGPPVPIDWQITTR